jgi:hypothetical protein
MKRGRSTYTTSSDLLTNSNHQSIVSKDLKFKESSTLSLFRASVNVLNTCWCFQHLSLIKFFKIFKTLYVSTSIGHTQVLKLFVKRIAVIFFRYSCLIVPFSFVCLIPCCSFACLWVINSLNPEESSGYSLIAGKILKELPIMRINVGTIYLTQLFNTVLFWGHFPAQWKVA